MGRVVSTAVRPTPPRADLERIWPYIPGRHRDEIVRRYGVTDVLKLASNENALGPSPKAMAALAAVSDAAHHYPDSQAVRLRSALAERDGLAVENIILGNGSVECIDLVARAFLRPGDRAVVGFPSFPRFTIACQVVGAETTVVPHQSWGFDLDGVIDAVDDRTRVVFLDNPCNPTGAHIPGEEIGAFLDRLPSEVLVVLDRAYYEFVPAARRFDEDLSRIQSGANLVVLRTFSKAFGLAGLRLGYAIARPETVAAMNRIREAFNTSVYAQAAGLAALDDLDHVQRSVAVVETERAWLVGQIARLGLETAPSMTNFLFTDLGPRAAEINEGLLRRGIVIRPMAAREIDTWARISIPIREHGERLVGALEELIG